MNSIKELLNKLAIGGGKIVSSASLSELQIAKAIAEGRMFVDSDSLGYVWEPPNTDGEERLLTDEEKIYRLMNPDLDGDAPNSMPLPPKEPFA